MIDPSQVLSVAMNSAQVLDEGPHFLHDGSSLMSTDSNAINQQPVIEEQVLQSGQIIQNIQYYSPLPAEFQQQKSAGNNNKYVLSNSPNNYSIGSSYESMVQSINPPQYVISNDNDYTTTSLNASPSNAKHNYLKRRRKLQTTDGKVIIKVGKPPSPVPDTPEIEYKADGRVIIRANTRLEIENNPSEFQKSRKRKYSAIENELMSSNSCDFDVKINDIVPEPYPSEPPPRETFVKHTPQNKTYTCSNCNSTFLKALNLRWILILETFSLEIFDWACKCLQNI